MIRKFKQLEDLLGLCNHGLKLIHGIFRLGKLYHLNLVELMDSDNSTRISSRRSCFLTKTRCKCRVEKWQLVCVKNLSTMDIGKLNLRGWNEVKVGLYVIEIILKLGKLSRSKERIMIGDDRRPKFLKTGFIVLVNHKVDKRALHTGTKSTKKVEPCSGKLYASIKVNNPQVNAEIPVCFRFKIKFSRGTPAANFRIVGIINAIGHRLIRDVWNRSHKRRQLLFNATATLIKLGYAFLVGANLLLCCLSFILFTLSHKKADLF